MYILMMAGRLEEAKQLGTELLRAGGDEHPAAEEIKWELARLEILRGNLDVAREHLSGCRAWAENDDVQWRGLYLAGQAEASLAEGRSQRALETARRAVDAALSGGREVASTTVRVAFPIAFEAAIEAGDLEQADQLVETLAARPRGEVPPFLRAQVSRAKALVAGARGEDEAVEENLVAAEATFRELGYLYWVARSQLERAEWLARQGRLDESARLAREAAATFDTVGAVAMVGRARALFEPGVAVRGAESRTYS